MRVMMIVGVAPMIASIVHVVSRFVAVPPSLGPVLLGLLGFEIHCDFRVRAGRERVGSGFEVKMVGGR